MRLNVCLAIFVFGVCYGPRAWAGPEPELVSDEPIQGSVATLRMDTHRMAAAVSSFKWQHVEFVDVSDHGREIQSAVSFDDLGECFNPTEAGSKADGGGPTSSSKLLSFEMKDGYFVTNPDAAFWLAPGEAYSGGCGSRPEVKRALNQAVRNGYHIGKRVRFGYRGISNALDWQVTFTVPEGHSKATFEVLTGYMPSIFSRFYRFQSSPSATAVPLSDGPGEQSEPVILSTPDGQAAMGIYCPGLPQASYPNAGYGRWRFHNVVKWNCVHRLNGVQKSEYTFQAIVLFGPLSSVEAALRRIVNMNSADKR